jgi:hypothetical protein
MYVTINPESLVGWDGYFASQARQTGHNNLMAFRGTNFQRGSGMRGAGIGSIFSNLFRALLPAVKTVGKQALMTGADIATDVLQGQNLKSSAKKRGRVGAARLVTKAKKKISQQKGGAMARKRRRRRTKKSGPIVRKKARQIGGARRKRRTTTKRKRRKRAVGVRRKNIGSIFQL